MIKNKIVANASWIIGCRIIQAVLNLVVGMISARYLGPSGYGLINYAASLVAFGLPIAQLGINHVIVQEFVNEPEKEGEILGTSLVLGSVSAVTCVLAIMVFVGFVNAGEQTTIIVCLLYSISLIFQTMELIRYWYQAKLIAKYTSVVSLVAYVAISVYKILLLATGSNIYWFAVANTLDCIIIVILLLIIYYRLGGKLFSFSKSRAAKLVSVGKYYIISSLMVTVFAQTDKIMLKLMLNEVETGYYSAAVTLTMITAFVFNAIIDSTRLTIFKRLGLSTEAFENGIVQLYSIIIYLSLAQSICMTLLANPLIEFIYGNDFLPAASALKIATWYSTFAYVGSIRDIWLLAMKQQKVLWKINLSGAIINVMLNYLLIPVMGINGAALASLCTQFFTNFLITYLIRSIRRNNTLLIYSLNPKCIMTLISSIRKIDD